MRKKIIKKWKDNYVWLCSSAIVALFILIFMYIFKVCPFGSITFSRSDCYHQMYMMLVVLHDKMINHENIFYQWNSGLGGDFLPTYFYYIASPINLLVRFIEKENIQSFISITVAFKMVFSAGAFGYYLSRRNGKVDNNIIYIALACAYALSNYMCSYYYEIMWTDSIMVFPLIMLGYERMIRNNSPFLYILSLAYSLFCNYYISYMICLFLIIWFIIDDYKSFKDFIIRGIRFSCFSILSAGMVAISLISSYIGLKKTFSYTEDMITHKWYGNIFEVIRYQFICSKPIITSYQENNSNIYCGTIVIFSLLLYMLNGKINIIDKVKRLIVIIVFYFSMNESLLNYVWHGFHKQHGVPNRFAFIFIFILLLTVADSIDHIISEKPVVLLVSLILSELLPVISYIFVDFDSILSSHQVLILSSLLVLIYSLLFIGLINEQKNILKIFCITLITLLYVTEIIFNSTLVIRDKMADAFADNIIFYNVDLAKNEIDKVDNSIFYRSEIDGIYIDNANMFHGMYGVSVFNSTNNLNYILFSQYMGDHTGINRLMYFQSKNYLDDLVGVKYIYAYDGTTDYDYDSNYEQILNKNGVVVYKNNKALNIGFGVDKSIREFNWLEQDILSDNINYFVKCLGFDDNIIRRINSKYSMNSSGCEVGIGDTDYLSLNYEVDESSKDDKNINIEFDIEEEGSYFIDIRSTNEDMLTISLNNQELKRSIWLVNGLNTLGNLKRGDRVSVSITENKEKAYHNNLPEAEIKILVYILDNEKVEEFVDQLAMNQLTLNSFSSDSFSGSINIDKDKILMLSIPYDKGWHVYENGKELKTEKLAHTFLGVDLSEGEHNLTFVFIPEGLYIGIMVTVIFWIFFIVYIIWSRNFKRKVDLPN